MLDKLKVSNIIFTNELTIDELINDYIGLLVCKKCNGFYYGNKRAKQKENKKYVYYKYVCQHRNKLNKYINKIIVDYPNLEIHFKFSSNIDNSVKEAKKTNEIIRPFMWLLL